MREKTKERGKGHGKGRFSLVVGFVFLAVSLVVVLSMVLQAKGLLPSFLSSLLASGSDLFGFHMVSPYALAPFAAFLLFLAVGVFVWRKKGPFAFLTYPVMMALYMTLNFLFGMHKGQSSWPVSVYRSLMASSTLRQASLKVALALIGEVVLLFGMILLAMPLNARWRRKKDFSVKLAEQKQEPTAALPVGENVDGKTRKEEAKRIRIEERQRKKQQRKEEKRQLKLQKKQDKKQKNQATEAETVVTVPFKDNGGLAFPPLMEVPAIDNLQRPIAGTKEAKEEVMGEETPEPPVTPQEDVSLVSVGALNAIKQEVERTKAEPFVEKPARKTISGFLQGALEAMGKGKSNKKDGGQTQQFAKGKGLLVEAVEQNEKRNHDISSMGSSFSKPVGDSEREVLRQVEPVVETVRAVPIPPRVEPPKTTYTPKEEPVPQNVETPKPVFTHPQEEAPIPVVMPEKTEPVNEKPEIENTLEEEDTLECESGVGGLQSAHNASALLNRSRLDYHYPSPDLLLDYPSSNSEIDEETRAKGDRLVQTLAEFHVKVELINIVKGPTVTMFEILPAPGVRVNAIDSLADNIQLRLPAIQVRIVAPIPGKSLVGVEIPNQKRDTIGFKEMLPSIDLKKYKIPMVLGKNLLGEPIVIDVASTPHLLIAGATGSGKSVCVNSLICSILYRKSPKQVRLILVDPKIVELQIYNGIPHLLTPVITEPDRTLKALDFCLGEMDRRYRLLQGLNTRNIVGYNERIEDSHICREKLPYIVVIIDEFADLMHTVGKQMEAKVSRLAAMSRAVGIHLVLATQRPSVDVITGIIKTNIPSRIAFAVTSSTDSRIIIDSMGAEKLLGRGDMLYASATDPVPSRIQGAFLSDEEVEHVVQVVSKEGTQDFIDEDYFKEAEPEKGKGDEYGEGEMIGGDMDRDDDLMKQALEIVVQRKCASASFLQRRLSIGFNRASRLVEEMEKQGIVGPPQGGSKSRPLLRYPDSVSVGQADAGNVVTGGEEDPL